MLCWYYMNVLRYILGAIAAAIPLTAASIIWFPTTDFIQYVVPVLQVSVVAIAVLTAFPS